MTSLRSRIPWWTKIGAKLVLSRLPVSYGSWRRLSLFRHGAMDDPGYAHRVLAQHLRRLGAPLRPGFVALEIGPGDSVSSALVARALGASRCFLVDTDDYAERDLAGYEKMARHLTEQGLSLPDLSGCASFEDLLLRLDARYETRGVESLREIPGSSVDLVFSQAVLEHVRRRDVADLLRESRRILRPDGACSHSVDLQDHLRGALNHLRLPDWFWENDAVARSGFYTNRLRFSEWDDLFREAGFRPELVAVARWDSLPTPRAILAPAFRALPDEDLRVSGFDVVLRPVS